ncbi:hypothetical protein [Tunturiibacter psychrotolerans]|uniref:hypothetical protein n=1 Tax=Tunturiibacter psychrotolerans TaxID=3069686 RepID=UPI003D1E7AB0
MNHSHEYFIELCALSTSGILSEDEWKQLKEHLSHCASCTKLKAEYEHVLVSAIPALASDLIGEDDEGFLSANWSIDKAEASLMTALDRENITTDIGVAPASPVRKGSSHWIHPIAALFLIASAYVGYRIGVRQSHTAASSVSTSPVAINLAQADGPSANKASPSGKTTEDQLSRTAELQHQLEAKQLELSKLHDQKSQLVTDWSDLLFQ